MRRRCEREVIGRHRIAVTDYLELDTQEWTLQSLAIIVSADSRTRWLSDKCTRHPNSLGPIAMAQLLPASKENEVAAFE